MREARESSGPACLGYTGLGRAGLGRTGLWCAGLERAGRGHAVQLKQERPCLNKEEGWKEPTVVTCPLSVTHANICFE